MMLDFFLLLFGFPLLFARAFLRRPAEPEAEIIDARDLFAARRRRA